MILPPSPEVQAEALARAAQAEIPDSERATVEMMDAAPLDSLAADRDGDPMVKQADGWHICYLDEWGDWVPLPFPLDAVGVFLTLSPVRIVREGPA